jgi:hypothetical protein
MANIDILNYKDIDIENIVFNTPIKIRGGSYMSSAEYNNKAIYIQTPRLITNKGIIKNDTRCSLDLDFDKEHWKFYEFMTNVDDHNVLQIQKNSKTWFSKDFPLDIVEEFYSTPIKIGRGNKPPTLKVKIPLVKNEISCNIYNANNDIISYNDIKLDSKILCVLKLHGLRYLKQQVICEWVPIQIKVFQESHKNNIYMINDNLLSDYEHDNKDIDNYELINKDFDETTNMNELNADNIELNNDNSNDNSNELNAGNIELNNDNSNELNNDNSNELNAGNSNELNAGNIELNNDNSNELNADNIELNNDNSNDNSNELSDNIEFNNDNSNELNSDNIEFNNDNSNDNIEFNDNELNNLTIKYTNIIQEKDTIIENLQNKFNKLKDFIN